MAVSNVDIANRALTKLGAGRIMDLDDNVHAAKTIKSMFAVVRDNELRDHVWSFSKARAQLPALATAPEFGFEYQYQLPSNYIRLLQLADFWTYPNPTPQGLYAIEGRAILTNAPAPLRIRYIRQIEDPTQFDASFIEVLACRLAAECCEALTNSNTKKQAAWQEYDEMMRRAIRSNSIELPALAIEDDTWLEARY